MEWKLLAAVINQAIEDASRGDKRAKYWLTASKDFDQLCKDLGFEPDWVRRNLKKFKREVWD